MYYTQYVEMNLCRLVGDDFKHFSKGNILIFRKIFAYPNVHRTPDLGFGMLLYFSLMWREWLGQSNVAWCENSNKNLVCLSRFGLGLGILNFWPFVLARPDLRTPQVSSHSQKTYSEILAHTKNGYRIAQNHRILEAKRKHSCFFSSQHFCFFPFFLKKPGIRYFWWGRWSSLNLKFAFPLGRWTLKARHMVIFAENEKVLQGCDRFFMVWQSCWAFLGKKIGGHFIFLCSKDFLLGQEHVPSTMHMSEASALG